MSYLFGQEGHWIIHGHPQYVAIGQKPKNGCENMLEVTLAEESSDLSFQEKCAPLPGSLRYEFGNKGNDGLLRGTNILKHVVSPWF